MLPPWCSEIDFAPAQLQKIGHIGSVCRESCSHKWENARQPCLGPGLGAVPRDRSVPGSPTRPVQSFHKAEERFCVQQKLGWANKAAILDKARHMVNGVFGHAKGSSRLMIGDSCTSWIARSSVLGRSPRGSRGRDQRRLLQAALLTFATTMSSIKRAEPNTGGSRSCSADTDRITDMYMYL